MNLVDTPMKIQQQFKKVDNKYQLSILTKESALNYYSQFVHQILNGNTLPCPINFTKFSNVKNFCDFLGFLLKIRTVQ